jgi:hydrogenase maturation protease
MNEWEWQLLEDKAPLDVVEIEGVELRRGNRVRLRPRAGADVFDLALAGRVAMIESFQQDYEGKVHVCVVLEDDPGKDVGMMRQPGHRFFFSVDEVEPIGPNDVAAMAEVARKKILIAGIGNIFLGDDGFGVEVSNRLLCGPGLPAGVRVVDFGIRGFDLAYALMEGYETTILVDALPGNEAPGTISVVEPDLAEFQTEEAAAGFVEPHAMNPVSVLRMAAGMGAKLQRVLVVGCVPATLGPEEGLMGLSEPVSASVEEAARLVESLVTRILKGEWPGEAPDSGSSTSKGDCHGDRAHES